MNDVLIIRIGSLSEFFSGSAIKLEAVLHLIELDIHFIMGVHMSRSKYISVMGRTYPDKKLPEETNVKDV